MRLFNKEQKLAVELVTGMIGNADHIKPFSKGGETSVENCQLIDPGINRKKGSFNFTPRKWQGEFFEKVVAGELSANAAAIKAGWRKVKSPLEHLSHWWSKASQEERVAFIAEVAK
jgi:hypothetical protein